MNAEEWARRYAFTGTDRYVPVENYPGYFMNLQGRLEPERETVTFAGGFSAGQLASTGIISYAIVRLLGASVPGAIAMGIGNVLWEAGSPAIPAGWKRYVLGLFRKPHE
ncbi:Uncharacterised protein [uncultured archaeon]|nr:Uncharacterised protein [uncultured archaeon]